jgi:hypothetical protein
VIVSLKSRSGAGCAGSVIPDVLAGPKAVVAPVGDPGLYEFLQKLLRRIEDLIRLRPDIWRDFARLFGDFHDARG